MRLATTFPFPALSLVALSLAVGATLAYTPIEPVEALNVDIVSSDESVVQREQLRVHREPWAHHSVWKGSYVCAQGQSSMTLTIDVAASGAATARYDFGPTSDNPTVPVGAFLLAGSLQPNDSGGFFGELDATQWIVHPDNYFMVALSIRTSDGLHLIGKSHHDTCYEFEITRIE